MDENPELAAHYGVQGIPAVKAFRNGRVVGEFVGAQPEPAVRKFLKQIAPNEADQTLERAADLLAAGRAAEAEVAYRRIQSGAPDHPVARLGLVRALLAQGKGQAAERLLEGFPESREKVTAEKLSPLAQLITESLSGDSHDDAHRLDSLYHRAGQLAAQANFPAAMDELLQILRQDKRYRQGQPRQVMLAIFELWGQDGPLTREYRNKLASVLF